MFQGLRFVARLKWWLVLCLVVVVGLGLIIGLPDSQVRAATITITVPQGETGFILSPETAGQSLITTTGLVTSDVLYDVTAIDAMEVSKNGTYAGQMLEWDGADWTTTALTNAVVVNTTHASRNSGVLPYTLDNTGATIISGALADTDDNLLITVTIDTVGGDVTLTEAGHWYKITISFTASEAS